MIAVDGIANANGHNNGNGWHSQMLGSLPLPSFEEIKDLNVHQRIRWVIAEARSVPRSQWNPDGEFQYAGHDQIVDMLRVLLAKYGVNIYQEPMEFSREGTHGGFDHLTRVKYEYEVVNADQPDDKITRHNWGEALDNGDKGMNKCSTIAEKMFLLRLFKIPTHDDPDANSAQRSQKGTAGQNGDKNRASKFSGPGPNECQDCGHLITAARRENKAWQLNEIIAASQKKFGKRFCVDCYLKAVSREGQHSQQRHAPVTTPTATDRSNDAVSAGAAPPSDSPGDTQVTHDAATAGSPTVRSQ